MAGRYSDAPWGYAGMRVDLYRINRDGSRWGIRSARGPIASAATPAPLLELVKANAWSLA